MRSGARSSAIALALCGALVAAAGAADVKQLSGNLKRAVGAQNAEQIQQAVEGLLDAGGRDALEAVLEHLPKLTRASGTTYWQLVGGAAGFRDRAALEALGDYVVKQKNAPFVRDLLFALENNTSPHTARALAKVLEKGPYDLQLMAADQLARVRTVEGVDALIAQLKKEGDKGDPELRRRLMTSLQAITGENMGDSLNWIGWWEANRAKGVPAKAGEGGDGDDHARAGLASQTLDPNRKREFESLQRNPNRILVISSKRPDDAAKSPGHDYNYDHMEAVLQQMDIAHTVVLKEHFEKDPDKYLKDAWTILVNCNNIQNQCVCKECSRLLTERKRQGANIGPTTNRLYGCPPDCPQGHDQVSFRMSKETVERLKKWVGEGGYLFTEDWGIVEVVEVGWPTVVKSSEKTDAQGGKSVGTIAAMDVTIMPGRGLTSLPLLRGVFTRPRPPAVEPDPNAGDAGTKTRDPGAPSPAAPPSHRWKIDDESPSIKVVDQGAVTVLMESEDLQKAAGGDGSVAVTFRYGTGSPRKQGEGAAPDRVRTGGGGGADAGKSRGRGEWAEEQRGGRVLHVMSHFGKQQGSRDDTFVLQNLILNFIMESNRLHMP